MLIYVNINGNLNMQTGAFCRIIIWIQTIILMPFDVQSSWYSINKNE